MQDNDILNQFRLLVEEAPSYFAPQYDFDGKKQIWLDRARMTLARRAATTLIRQKSENDCVLAAIAMAIGVQKWEDLWSDDDLKAVIASQGVGRAEYQTYLSRAGLQRHVDYKEVYLRHTDAASVHDLLWGRRALLSVHSLNVNNGLHAVYWDGSSIYDPQEGVEGKQHYRHLSSLVITTAILLKF